MLCGGRAGTALSSQVAGRRRCSSSSPGEGLSFSVCRRRCHRHRGGPAPRPGSEAPLQNKPREWGSGSRSSRGGKQERCALSCSGPPLALGSTGRLQLRKNFHGKSSRPGPARSAQGSWGQRRAARDGGLVRPRGSHSAAASLLFRETPGPGARGWQSLWKPLLAACPSRWTPESSWPCYPPEPPVLQGVWALAFDSKLSEQKSRSDTPPSEGPTWTLLPQKLHVFSLALEGILSPEC